MKYNKTLVTPPLSMLTSKHRVDLPRGDTYFLSLRVWKALGLSLPQSEPFEPTPNPNTIFIDTSFKGAYASVKEGTTLSFDISCSTPADVDTSVNWTITHNAIVPSAWIKRETEEENEVNYASLCVTNTSDADFGSVSGTAIITAGNSSINVQITTNDDTVLSGGSGYFRAGLLTIISTDNVRYMLQPDGDSAILIIEDNNILPPLQGLITMGGKLHPLLSTEPLIDPMTDEIVSFNIGFTGADSNLRTFTIDDMPLDEITINIPTILATDASDITGVPIFLQAIIHSGNRA